MFERAMHDFQDTFCHRDKAPDWDFTGGILWHFLNGTKPDEDMDSWERANQETKVIVDDLKNKKLSEQEKLQCGYDNLYDKWINEKSLPFDFGQEKYDEWWKENRAEDLKKAESDKP